MRKHIGALMPLLVVVFFGSFGTLKAQENGVSLLNPGTLPDSAFYGMDLVLERIGDVFVVGEEARVRRDALIAEERLAEVEAMDRKGDAERAAKALTRAEERLAKAVERLASLDDVDVSRRADLLLDVQTSVQKHLVVLARVQAKAPEAAQKGLENAIEASGKVVDHLNETRREIADSKPLDKKVKEKLESTPAIEKLAESEDRSDRDEDEDEDEDGEDEDDDEDESEDEGENEDEDDDE